MAAETAADIRAEGVPEDSHKGGGNTPSTPPLTPPSPPIQTAYRPHTDGVQTNSLTERRRAWSRRKVRPKTLEPRTLRQQARRRVSLPVDDSDRPMFRGDCKGGERPCPWVSCKYHLYLDVNPDNGSIKLNYPHLGVDEIPETCSLDVADLVSEKEGKAELAHDEIGRILNLTHERARQIELKALYQITFKMWKLREEGKI